MAGRLLLHALSLLLPILTPAHAAILSTGASTQHLGGVGGHTPASGENQTFTMWFYLESDINRAASLFLYVNNDSPLDGFGLVLASDGTTANFIVIHDTSVSDTATCQKMAVGRWYFFALQREGATYRCYAGDDRTVASLTVTHIETGVPSPQPSWGIGILGSGLANDSPNARVERFKHYTAALDATRIEEERASLTPFSTTGLFSYNAFESDYAGSLGASPYRFHAQGGTSFSPALGPTLVQPCKHPVSHHRAMPGGWNTRPGFD
jgi:hypothetical protein